MEKVYEIIDHHLIFEIKGRVVDIDLRKLIWPASALSVFYLLFWKKSGFIDMDTVKQLENCQSESKENEDDKPYRHQPVNIPALKGRLAYIYRKVLRSPFGRAFLVDNGKQQGGLDLFLKLHLPDKPTYYPIVHPETTERNETEQELDLWKFIQPSTGEEFHFNTISDYVEEYRTGSCTPTDVARNVIAAIKNSEARTPRMRMIIEFHEDDILSRAAESTERWKANKPLSVFDGIPVAVKDEIFLEKGTSQDVDVQYQGGYPCRAGLPIEKFGVEKQLSDEGWMIHKLREGGAMFIGVANMHQLGTGITGINPSKYHGTARNPYNPNYPPGGSSSGPASSVASGLCPVAIAADGGGSIRIPAAVNGVSGAKATFARISQTGIHANCDTVSHAGAICATSRDSAIFYGYVAGLDPEYAIGHVQPAPFLDQFDKKDLTGLTIGIDWNFFNDAIPEIVEECKKGVDYLVNSCGAKLQEISIPELQEGSRAHVVATLTEMYTYGREIYHKYHDDLNTDTEINLGLGSTFTSSEYYLAQKQRTRNMNILKRLFKEVDCIITPTTGDFLPKLDKDSLKYGYNNLKHLTDMIRFNVLGNLAGHPSISVPVGYSKEEGLPIGVLIQTAWWKEDLMFRIAHSMEGYCELRKPQVFYDLLEKSSSSTKDESNGTGSPSSSSPML